MKKNVVWARIVALFVQKRVGKNGKTHQLVYVSVWNMGHNRKKNNLRYPYLIRKSFSMSHRIGDLINHARIFPMDSLRLVP